MSGPTVFMLICLGVSGVAHLARNKGESAVREEAIKTGHAEYYLDENGNKQFRWEAIPAEAPSIPQGGPE